MPRYAYRYTNDDGWEITDGDGEVIAILDTELLADVLLAWLVDGMVHGGTLPSFSSGIPLGTTEQHHEE
jgi:hypothetical protein